MLGAFNNTNHPGKSVEAKTIAIDLAKNVFELAIADEWGKVLDRKRLNRSQLQRYFQNHAPVRIVMEACGTSHFWGRWFLERGMEVSLLPPLYVKAYVRRNKTDRADATALLEAARATDIIPVQVKSAEQQALQSMHRVRSAWRSTLTDRVNCLRGVCREFGVLAPLGVQRGLKELGAQLADDESTIPKIIRSVLQRLVEEIRSAQERLKQIDAELAAIAEQSDVCQRLQKIPGVGPLSATAFAGSIADIRTFRNSRRLASWLGLTPREHSSGNIRRLGSISKRGDSYLRRLLVNGGRAVLYSANMAQRAGRPLDALRDWGLRLRARVGHNKAAVAVANKLARLIWATWYQGRDFEFREPVPQPV
jgi:transposase